MSAIATQGGIQILESHELKSVRLAARSWIGSGSPGLLTRWLARELDAVAMPIGMPLPDWTPALVELALARKARAGWHDPLDARIGLFFESVMRFSRPTGIAATTDFEGVDATQARAAYRYWASVFPDTGAARVSSMWFPHRDDDANSPPPLPAWSSEKRPLAILRAEWLKGGDFLAVDHRQPGPSTSFELFGGGRPWLGSKWSLSPGGPTEARARIKAYHTGYMADLLEWTFRQGDGRVTRTALLLRGRRLALLADQVDSVGLAADMAPVSLHLAVNPGTRTEGEEETRSLLLRRQGDRASARAIPLALPCSPYKTDKGSFHTLEGSLVLNQARSARRIWLPVLVSWDATRNRKALQWRALTVSERSKICAPEVAVAYRARWGLDETIVVYRSLAKPGLRAFLGHQTTARFLVGTFSSDGVVKPLISIE